MSNVSERLEQQADLLFNNVAGWERNALRRIGRRVKDIKSLSYADLQAINNAAIVKQDVNAILKELATLTGQSSIEVKRVYAEMIDKQHEENKILYDYKGKPFISLADNKPLQAIVNAYARTTAETMVNLSMTKAKRLGFVDKNNNFVPLEKNFKQVLDKAVMSITTGTGDFNSEMRGVLKELGGSGLRVDYGGGITRRLDTMVRQNLLWGVKQAQNSYSALIGEELNCNGIEIDFHFHPRPSHEFFQGKQYSTIGKKVINGVTYPDAEQEGVYKALNDYGCLHFSTPILLGISEPRYSPEELKRLNEQNKRKFNVEGKELSGYECRQGMRRIETEIRKTKDQMAILKASGDNTGAEQLRQRLKVFNEKYKMIAETTGIKPQSNRMAIIKTKTIDNAVKSGYNETAKNISGARITDLYSEEAETFANSYYEEVRHFSTDIKRISDNLGIDYDNIKKVKEYLFIDNSKFDEETGQWVRFDPDCAVAHSWQRLMLGKNIKPHDRTLIYHELYEMEIKKQNKGIAHLEAHKMASKKYNYQKEAEEYYANLAKHKKGR